MQHIRKIMFVVFFVFINVFKPILPRPPNKRDEIFKLICNFEIRFCFFCNVCNYSLLHCQVHTNCTHPLLVTRQMQTVMAG